MTTYLWRYIIPCMVSFGNPEIILKKPTRRTVEAVRVPFQIGNQPKVFSVILGDLTRVDAEAIACPTDTHFDYARVGLQGVLVRAAGTEVFKEVKQKAQELVVSGEGMGFVTPTGYTIGLNFGYTIATSAGRLERFQKILHVNSRVIQGYYYPDEVVRMSVAGVLKTAEELALKSVALPVFRYGLETGVSGESIKRTASGIYRFLRDYQKDQLGLERILLVVYAGSNLGNALTIQEFIKPDLS